jgi:uncharacterized membrane protein YccF (DUF307 family)
MQTSSSQHLKEISFRRDRRGPCDWILNILWLLLGGWHLFLTWFFAGLILCATCIAMPCGWQVIKISLFLLFPFGKRIVYTHDFIEGEGGRCCMRSCNCLLNIVWAVTAGWILALQAFLTGCLLMVTIVGIPFGIQCFKLTILCFCPFGIDFSAEEVETIVVSTSGANYHSMGVV